MQVKTAHLGLDKSLTHLREEVVPDDSDIYFATEAICKSIVCAGYIIAHAFGEAMERYGG